MRRGGTLASRPSPLTPYAHRLYCTRPGPKTIHLRSVVAVLVSLVLLPCSLDREIPSGALLAQWIELYKRGLSGSVDRAIPNGALVSQWKNYVKWGRSGQVSFSHGTMVAERLACSPPTKASQVQSPGRVTPDFPHVAIVPEDVVGRRVFKGISRFPCPCILVLLHTHLAS
ncbi:hypothetical protein PR048_024928 [Dryococelus australis]|uniref:Uncharacterized protein n=1 Tax=Dryococelus australis TaxID=614101 RepID=A0ABQ9GQ05_9NEOP|nr:hypothetical protein PR048_024928 [Dryococelus australis]